MKQLMIIFRITKLYLVICGDILTLNEIGYLDTCSSYGRKYCLLSMIVKVYKADMDLNARKHVFGSLQTTKVQTNLRIRAV